MLATYTEPRLTPLTFEEAAEALGHALRDALGQKPSDGVLALTLAKCELETARFRSIWRWNFGNIKAGADYVGQFTCIELNEVLTEGGVRRVVWFAPGGRLDRKGGRVVAEAHAVPPGHPQTRMRAHANRFDGAFAYVDFMHRDKRGAVRPMWRALLLGEPVAFVRAMKAAGYFTADETTYAKAVASLFRESKLRLEGRAPETAQVPDESEAEWESLRARVADLQATYAHDLLENPAKGLE